MFCSLTVLVYHASNAINDQHVDLFLDLALSGFFHEQARDDRDRFVEVKWENILDGE